MTRRTRSSTLGVAAIGIVALASSVAGVSARTTATLELRGSLRVVSDQTNCPIPTTDAGVCAARDGKGLIPGLGSVSESYAFLADLDLPPCLPGSGRTRAYPVTFVVAGKGEIHFSLAEGATCVRQEAVRTQTQAFTITGGTGIYAGASGSGTVERALGSVTAGGQRAGPETWRGTLVAPGAAAFDVTRPTLSGGANRTMRAPRGAKTARVRFTVTARDAIDGVRPVTCTPRSGSRFKLGKTTVRCSAADTSGNVAGVRFTVTVEATS